MPFDIFAAGGTLYRMTTAGVATALTLPTGVTLSSTRAARMVISGRNIVITNGATRSLIVDPEFTVRPLILRPPSSAPTIAAGAAGGLTGTYRCKYTFIIKDVNSGALLSESAFSPISASLTVAAQLIAVTGVQASPDTQTTHRRLYRIATGGTAYFHWIDLDGNTLTEIHSDASDAALALVAAPTGLGSAPGMAPGTFMTVIAAWKDRLWGVGNESIDTLVYTNASTSYGWPNSINIPIAGADEFGITGIMPRRDELGIAKRNVLFKIVTSAGSSFDLIKVKEGKGCWAPASVVIIDDIAYFLGEDGVYTWGPGGVQSISDEKVRGWFATTTYFNRSEFQNAVGRYNSTYHWYELLLAPTGVTARTRWIAYDIKTGKWFGPHLTDDFTPAFASSMVDANSLSVPILGGTDGFIYYQDSAATTDDGTLITMSGLSKRHDGNTPDIEKLWLQPSLISKIQTAAGAFSITAAVGALNAGVTLTFSPNMTLGREKFARLDRGRFVQIGFAGTTSASQGVEIYGYEVPFHEVGRR